MYDHDDRIKSLLFYLIPKRRFIKWCAITVLALLIAGFARVHYYAVYHFKPFVVQTVGAKEYQRMKELWEKKLEFPAAYMDAIPESNDLYFAKTAVARSRKIIDSNVQSATFPFTDPFHHLSLLITDEGKLSDEEKKELGSAFQLITPYLNAVRNVAKQIEKDVESLSPGDFLPIHDNNSWINDTGEQWLSAKAEYLLLRKDFNEAFEHYIACFPLLLTCPYQDFSRFDRTRYSLRSLSSEIPLFLGSVSSKKSLRDGLRTLNRIEPFLYQDTGDQRFEIYLISRLRKQKQRDSQIDATPGRTCYSYHNQLARNANPYMFNTNHMNFSKCLPYMWHYVLAGRPLTKNEIAGLLRPFSFSKIFSEYLLLQELRYMNLVNFKQQETNDAADYDILRLKIAARLYELETGKKVTATSDLVPEYFPEEIKERSTGATYKWNSFGELLAF